MTDGRWTVDRPEVRVDPIPIPPLPFEGARVQRERITKQDIDEFGATIGCPGCNAIKDNKRAQAHSDRCRKRIEECLRNTPHGAERLDRRDDVIKEALAEEVRRGEQRKKRSDGTTAAVPETGSAAPEPVAGSAAPELREDPIEPDPNPKRRMLMKPASSTASGSGQQREKRPIPGGESRMQVEDMSETGTGEGTALPAAPSANTRRRIVVKSEPMEVTTQEAVGGYREKAMRIASVEQIELGNIMELSITGQVLKWARQENLSGGVSLRKADGWNLKNHSHLTVARHLREKIHPSMLVVTIREGEERGMCNAALREFLRISKDQMGERSVVVIVLSKRSTIWRKTSMRTLIREEQLRYIDVEEMRVVTNDRHMAEQIKTDKMESVVMNGSKVGKFGKIDGKQNLKSIVMNGVKSGKVGKLENCKSDEGMLSQSEERLCRSIIKGLVVYEKVEEKEAVEKYGVTPVDTKWVDTEKAFEGKPMQIRSRMCAREFKIDDRPDLYAGTPPLEALKAIISIAANKQRNFLNHAHRRVTCIRGQC